MDLQSLLSLSARSDSSLTQADSGKKAVTTTDQLAKLSPALAKARDRVVAQEQSTATSLSTLGRYKAALAALGTSSGALAKLGGASSAASIQSALQTFVADYNAAMAGARQSAGAGAGADLGTSNLLSDLRRALATTPRVGSTSLRSLGLATQADGSLKLDAKVLKSALASASADGASVLSQLGATVGKAVDAGLSGTGRLSSAMSSLDGRLAALKKQENALLAAAEKMAVAPTDPSSAAVAKALQQAYQTGQ
ncbi:flagellar filament capping protein FliD [Pelomonas sp. SE-A7]|uniref:flagellar filament capping protein FliD n=1 Tax=Pelomonas sp. SE-A7 TaxID=3054953 RepID=UPI00259D2D1A|nr:flagellar filament capping protein FliD [Pelomonas sp. SE-A7]MDM4765901.1 flagellar filament capping protein FliD [Pelomonas sp. SE-A7]